MFEALLGEANVLLRLVDADVLSAKQGGGDGGGAAAVEGVEDDVAGVGGGEDDAVEHADGHLAAVPAFAFAEGAADPADVPGVGGGLEELRGRFLGAEIPHVIGKLALGVGADVVVGGLAGAGDAHGVGVEGEGHVFLRLQRLLGEIEDVRVALGEFELGLLAKGVVPDDPIAQVEAELAAGDDAEVGGVFIADGEVERSGGFEDALDGLHPVVAEL